MTRKGDLGRGRARGKEICRVVLGSVLWLLIGVESTLAETQSVIDPYEVAEPPNPSASTTKKPPQPDATLKRERQRAADEQGKRAKAEARALAAENEAAKLRAMEQTRQADATAQAAAAKAAARKAAANRAVAAKMAKARIAAEKEAAEKEAAVKEAAARETAAREAIARETAAREAAAREIAARETAAREAAAREAAAREEARQTAARETAAREAAAREAAAREEARQTAAREAAAREVAAREAAAREAAREIAAREARPSRLQPRFGTVFRDCADCPEVVWLRQGELIVGEPSATSGSRHAVKISDTLAVGRFKVTFSEWDACVAAGGCRRRPDDSGWGRERQPVININWADAQQYAAWLSRRTSKHYRLLTGSEWQYAARAGSDVYDMHGNVPEWLADCYQYRDARSDGKTWTLDCTTQMVRGGAWQGFSNTTRSAPRSVAPFNNYDNRIGFRIARTE